MEKSNNILSKIKMNLTKQKYNSPMSNKKEIKTEKKMQKILDFVI